MRCKCELCGIDVEEVEEVGEEIEEKEMEVEEGQPAKPLTQPK